MGLVITSKDEDELSIWMMDSEKFLHYVDVPHGYTLEQAHAHHRDNVLRPLLDALLSLPATPVRQRLINDLRQLHFEDERPRGKQSPVDSRMSHGK